MKRESFELSVGIFVLAGILAVGYMAIQLGRLELWGSDHYQVQARFQSVSGLKTGARVEVSGVEVGQVTGIRLDEQTLAAIADLSVRKDIQLSEDTIASIRTAGLIGDKFVKLTPGGLPTFLEPGGMITDTESPVDLEELIAKYVFGSVDGGAKSAPESASEPTAEPKDATTQSQTKTGE